MERWRILPSQWDSMSEDDKAQLMGFVITQAEMKEYEDYLSERDQIKAEARRKIEAEVKATKP